VTEAALRVIGTSVTLHPHLMNLARQELGFPISFEVLDGLACQQRGVMQPETYDIYDQWFNSVDLLWTAGSIEAIDTTRIAQWRDLSPLATSTSFQSGGVGSRPVDVIYVQPNNALGNDVGRMISMLPTACNVDAFAYAKSHDHHTQPESWAWLFDDAWHGRTVISKDPASGVVELALSAQAAGLLRAENPCNLSIEEIDSLFAILMRYKRRGHFARSWTSHEESVRHFMMPSTMIGSLWSPAYFEVKGLGRHLHYACPQEGYRGWHSGLCLSAAVSDEMRDKAYVFFNWWLSGAPGAIMARQGYYMSVIDPVRNALPSDEWDFWYDGKPASRNLASLHGEVAILEGESRSGGSYHQRISKIAAWSTIMEEHNYVAHRWREFLE
jgi:putative spermidine/putrescine transport system substrate-binding protein